jgi:MATE family multidrug resistance protein
LGLAQFLIISATATLIYRWHGVSEEMITLGAPFLRLKSFGVFLIFISLSFIYFMKGIKNTRMPMVLNMVGIAAFIFFDYALVLGKFGFPQYDLNGSAIATIIQYTVMNVIALAYILWEPEYKKYFSKIFLSFFNWKKIIQLINLSWPIMIDKTSFAISYVWLAKLIASMGTPAIAAYDTIKNLERFAFLPAVAFAVIITFLVSNRLGADDPDGAMANIKKVLILTGLTVGTSLLCLCFNARYFVSMFDPHNQFTILGAAALPIISILVIFDFVQVILAGALRGAGDVYAVMYGRCATVLLFFIPVSYILSKLPIENQTARFVLIYGSHYVNAGLMGLIFLRRIMSHKWQKQKI